MTSPRVESRVARFLFAGGRNTPTGCRTWRTVRRPSLTHAAPSQPMRVAFVVKTPRVGTKRHATRSLNTHAPRSRVRLSRVGGQQADGVAPQHRHRRVLGDRQPHRRIVGASSDAPVASEDAFRSPSFRVIRRCPSRDIPRAISRAHLPRVRSRDPRVADSEGAVLDGRPSGARADPPLPSSPSPRSRASARLRSSSPNVRSFRTMISPDFSDRYGKKGKGGRSIGGLGGGGGGGGGMGGGGGGGRGPRVTGEATDARIQPSREPPSFSRISLLHARLPRRESTLDALACTTRSSTRRSVTFRSCSHPGRGHVAHPRHRSLGADGWRMRPISVQRRSCRGCAIEGAARTRRVDASSLTLKRTRRFSVVCAPCHARGVAQCSAALDP